MGLGLGLGLGVEVQVGVEVGVVCVTVCGVLFFGAHLVRKRQFCGFL